MASAASRSSSSDGSLNPKDLSPLFLGAENIEASYVGPVQVSVTSVLHGRGLVATKSITPGACLLVTPAVVQAPVATVQGRFTLQQEDSSLEQVAEQVLLEEIRNCRPQSKAALCSLVHDDNDETLKVIPSIEALMGRCELTEASNIDIDDNDWLQVIRRNAFGPDFYTFSRVSQIWQSNDSKFRPLRLLGLYPVAAMLNHSCLPNTVRVYCKSSKDAGGETMVVHATQSVKAGEEYVWSYVPLTQPYPMRSATLQQDYGFTCHCARCVAEEAAWKGPQGADLREMLSNVDELVGMDLLDALEDTVRPFASDTARYLRVGFYEGYVAGINAALQQNQNNTANDMNHKQLLTICMQLHLSLCTCHHASTEHLSILHVAYELMSVLHAQSPDPSKTISHLRYWTEQLKQAHMVRYGPCGAKLETVRHLLKTTRTILRSRLPVEYNFL